MIIFKIFIMGLETVSHAKYPERGTDIIECLNIILGRIRNMLRHQNCGVLFNISIG